MKLEKKGLEQRLQNLTTQAGMEFAKVDSLVWRDVRLICSRIVVDGTRATKTS